jgi:hypothetical protein
MARIIARFFLHKILFVAWFLVLASPALLIMWLLHGPEHAPSLVAWITASWGLVAFIAGWYLGHATTHYMVDENQMFLDSVKHALIDLRFKLVFVPIIGSWFTPDEDKTKPDDD